MANNWQNRPVGMIDGGWYWHKWGNSKFVAMGRLVLGTDGRWSFHHEGYAPYGLDELIEGGSVWISVPYPPGVEWLGSDGKPRKTS